MSSQGPAESTTTSPFAPYSPPDRTSPSEGRTTTEVAEGHRDRRDGRDGREYHDTGRELFFFVNRRRFGRADGVQDQMTGAQIASLIGVPADQAVIRRQGRDGGSTPVDVNAQIEIQRAEHFLVTRKHVDAGHA